MKKLLALAMAAVMLLTLCACGDDAKNDDKGNKTTAPTGTPPPEDIGRVAETFLKAYLTRNFAVRFDMYCYDARQRWEDTLIGQNGSAEAFFAEAQKQADEKGLDVTVDSFDSYLAAYHRFILADYQDMYGEHTITVKAVNHEKKDEAALKKTIDGVFGAVDEKYLDADALRAVTEGYTVKVEWTVDGEKQDLHEFYLVHIVSYKGKWCIADHSQ